MLAVLVPGTGRTALPCYLKTRLGHVTRFGKWILSKKDLCQFYFGRFRIYDLLCFFLYATGNDNAPDGGCVILGPRMRTVHSRAVSQSGGMHHMRRNHCSSTPLRCGGRLLLQQNLTNPDSPRKLRRFYLR